ncbi:MAG: ROK family protein [Christensenellales bacterium]
MRGSNIRDVRESNKALLYNCVRRSRSVTLSQLEQMTNLSRPTVTGLMREMEEEGRILRLGYETPVSGRAPVLYGINPAAAYAIGIDFDFPNCRMVISDLMGRIVAMEKERYPRASNTQQTLGKVIAQTERLISQSDIDPQKLLGIGLGMAGAIDIQSGRSIVFERIPDWRDIPVSDTLSECFDLPVFMKNDVHALTWAERRLWNRKEFSDMLFISIRSGIGMSVLLNGTVLEGKFGNAGFLGHTTIDIKGPLCTCGKRGCLELYTSELAMLQMYYERTGTPLDSITELVQLANQDDISARGVLESAGRCLGIGLGNASLLFDIPNIVINAQFDTAIILKQVQSILDENINQYRNIAKIRVFPGRLREPEYALGSCLMAIESAAEQNHYKFT